MVGTVGVVNAGDVVAAVNVVNILNAGDLANAIDAIGETRWFCGDTMVL